MFIDSGFRPGKKDKVPEHRVYEFCRRHRRVAFPTKGVKSARTPLRKSEIEVRQDGKKATYGLVLYVLDTDHWKSAIHERLRYPVDAPMAWLIDAEADERYLRQLVSEARVVKPSGDFEWVQRARDNHYLDCEAMAAAAGLLLGVQRITERQAENAVRDATKPPAGAPKSRSVPPPAEPEGEGIEEQVQPETTAPTVAPRSRSASRRLNG